MASAGDALLTAQAHLAAAEWAQARRAFEEVATTSATPTVLEGLSWAAWWLDDAAVTFEARRRAYLGFRRGGDVTGAARMATWLAIDHVDFHGSTGLANGWLRRAHRLLDPVPDRAEHGWLAFEEGYLAGGRGDIAAAIDGAVRAADIGRRCDVPDLEMLGLALEGATRVGCGEVAEGLGLLDESVAMVQAEETDLPISGSWALCFQVATCVSILDFDRGTHACDLIAERARRYGSRYMDAFCRAEYGEVHLWRGRWDDAERLLTASVADFTRSRPAMAGGPMAVLAELRRRQGRVREAVALLDAAGPSDQAVLCRARLEMDRGNVRRSAQIVERVLRRSSPQRRVDRAPALAQLVRARLACGEDQHARAALATLREDVTLVGTTAMTALLRLGEGLVAAAAGDHDRARSVLEDAVDGFERCGAVYDAACARLELATSLAALGHLDSARQETEAAAGVLERIGSDVDAARARQVGRNVVTARQGPRVTRRECDVLGLLSEGLTNQQIAARLVVSEHTVHRHVTNILRKLSLPSRTAAAAYAVRAGLQAPPE